MDLLTLMREDEKIDLFTSGIRLGVYHELSFHFRLFSVVDYIKTMDMVIIFIRTGHYFIVN